jgi:hypothetical protein
MFYKVDEIKPGMVLYHKGRPHKVASIEVSLFDAHEVPLQYELGLQTSVGDSFDNYPVGWLFRADHCFGVIE